MPARYVPPSTDATAFSCPHCGTYTTQYWYRLGGTRLDKDSLPDLQTRENVDALVARYKADMRGSGSEVNPKMLKNFMEQAEIAISGVPYFEGDSEYYHHHLRNIHVSRCYECDKLSVWRYDALMWPPGSEAPDANADLPTDVALDYREAGAILSVSPRGAAALLRLAIEKLCRHLLGEDSSGDLNKDIGLLVGLGLDQRIQMALDVVRVVGNEAVHPGTLDLRDDRSTAEKLFGLVNMIADFMISMPKHLADMYEALPPEKRAGIEVRNTKALSAPKSSKKPEET